MDFRTILKVQQWNLVLSEYLQYLWGLCDRQTHVRERKPRRDERVSLERKRRCRHRKRSEKNVPVPGHAGEPTEDQRASETMSRVGR